MARGAETITIYDDDECVDIEVTLWVDRDGELKIGISDENLRDTFPLTAAIEIGDAIQSLVTWSKTAEGKEKIAEMQTKEQEDYDRTVLKRPVKKASVKKKRAKKQ